MKIFACPSCGAEVKFVSAVSVFAVCSFCKSTIVRRDVDVNAIGKMATLLEDLSPLQIGSGGKFDKTNFTVIGRAKIMWTDGVWNEWHVFFDDGRYGWLAEAQGFWSISFAIADIPAPSSKSGVGKKCVLRGVNYTVDDLREATIQASEGELPFQALPGAKAMRMDLVGPGGAFASVDFEKPEGTLYMGRYVDFDELQMTNLRTLEGWKYERAG